MTTDPAVATQRRTRPTGESAGLLVALTLVVAAALLPQVLDWVVYTYAHPGPLDSTPLHGQWDPRVGPGTVPAVVIALLGLTYGPRLAEQLRWRTMLAASYVGAVAWMLSLAFVDGVDGVSRVLAHPYEYLQTARATSDVPALLHEWIDRIPLYSPDNLPTHVAGHPPGALLFFVALDRVGLGGDLAAGLVVTLVAATVPAAVLTTMRVLGAAGRRPPRGTLPRPGARSRVDVRLRRRRLLRDRSLGAVRPRSRRHDDRERTTGCVGGARWAAPRRPA